MSATTSPASEAPLRPVGHPAGLGRRLGAMLYDSLLILALWMMTLFVLVAAADGEPVTGWWVQLLLLAELAGFYLLCWRRGGQTLGMAAWRLTLLQSNGQPCTWGHLWRRLLTAPLSFICLGLGFFWVLFDARNATWHDRLSGTAVVHLPKSENA